MQNSSQARGLLVLLVVTGVASILHYVDNVIFFDAYPEPAWLTPQVVEVFWFVMTPFGVIGYWLFRRGSRWRGLSVLLAYGLMNLLTLGHYSYAPLSEISFRINLFILLEAGAAGALIVAVVWFALRTPRPEALEG